MEDEKLVDTDEDDEESRFICKRCHKPFELVRGRSIAKVKEGKFLCPKCFELLLS